MVVSEPDGTFLSAGGLPTRITQPEPSPLTRAADVQARAARAIRATREEIAAIISHFSIPDLSPDVQSQSITPEVLQHLQDHLNQVTTLLSELEFAANAARSTIETLRVERGQLQSLCVIAEHLNGTLHRQQLLNRVLEDLLVLVRGDRGAIFMQRAASSPSREGPSGSGTLRREYDAHLQFEAAFHRGQGALPLSDELICRAAVEQSWRQQEPHLIPAVQSEPLTSQDPSVTRNGIHSLMVSPLRTQDQVVGMVYVDRRETDRAFSSDDLDLLAAFCNLAAIALENADLFAQQQIQMQTVAAMKNYTDSILASIASGVIALDKSGRITRTNPAATRILGLSEREVLNKPYSAALQAIQNRTIIDRIAQSIDVPDIHDSFLADTTIADQTVPRRLNFIWSALRSADQQRLGTVIVIDDLTEIEAEREAAKRIERYVHPNVVELVRHHPSAAVLGGSTREISILFADLRDFTKLGESLAPEPLFTLLNEYLNLLTEIVFHEGGMVTMFQGDALMAIFNAPLDQADHSLRAVRAAWRMQTALREQNTRTGQKPVEFGIGVHIGQAYVGNIGHNRIQNYTAIGDAVNTAKRIQEVARENRVLMHDDLFRRIEDMVLVTPYQSVVVKGKSKPLTLWELRGLR